MIGTFQHRWKYTWSEVWQPLVEEIEVPDDLFVELYKAVVPFLKSDAAILNNPIAAARASAAIQQILNDSRVAEDAFATIQGADFKNEHAIVRFIEEAFESLGEFDMPQLSDKYSQLIEDFIERYNLRYQVVRPFRLNLRLPGVFAAFYQNLCTISDRNPHLAALMQEFQDSFNHYIRTRASGDLSTCICKATNLAEGIAATTLNVNGGELGELCDQIKSWPHPAVKKGLKALYGFTSDFPGLRHGGNPYSKSPSGKLRDLDLKDAVLISVLLVAFSGYLTNEVNAQDILE